MRSPYLHTHRDLDKIWRPSSDKKWSCATRLPHSARPSRLQPASQFRSDAGRWSGLGISRWYPNLSTQAPDNSYLFRASTGQYLLSRPQLRPRQHLSPSFRKQVNLSCWICKPPHHPGNRCCQQAYHLWGFQFARKLPWHDWWWINRTSPFHIFRAVRWRTHSLRRASRQIVFAWSCHLIIHIFFDLTNFCHQLTRNFWSFPSTGKPQYQTPKASS